MNLKNLWADASMEERRKLLLTMLDAVYVDAKKTKSVIAIKPKPPFKPVFQVAASRNGSKIRILNEPSYGSSVFLVGRGESNSRQKKLPGICYRFISSLILPGSPQLTELARPAGNSFTPYRRGAMAPRFSHQAQPVGAGPGWMAT